MNFLTLKLQPPTEIHVCRPLYRDKKKNELRFRDQMIDRVLTV